jgi:hypothetical protein
MRLQTKYGFEELGIGEQFPVRLTGRQTNGSPCAERDGYKVILAPGFARPRQGEHWVVEEITRWEAGHDWRACIYGRPIRRVS